MRVRNAVEFIVEILGAIVETNLPAKLADILMRVTSGTAITANAEHVTDVRILR
jgi:hypothetical protein